MNELFSPSSSFFFFSFCLLPYQHSIKSSFYLNKQKMTNVCMNMYMCGNYGWYIHISDICIMDFEWCITFQWLNLWLNSFVYVYACVALNDQIVSPRIVNVLYYMQTKQIAYKTVWSREKLCVCVVYMRFSGGKLAQ